MISTRSLHLLPDIGQVMRTCQSVAALDAVLSPQWEFRYYTFRQKWGSDRQLASMRDGSGDEWFLLFLAEGAVLKGFVHDALMAKRLSEDGQTWKGVLNEMPPAFHAMLQEPAFSPSDATFCVWRDKSDLEWRRGRIDFPLGEDPDGSEHLLAVLDGEPVTYVRWAEQYYEIEIPFIEVRRIYMHRPMTPEMARALNPNVKWSVLVEDLEQIGYPVAPGQTA